MAETLSDRKDNEDRPRAALTFDDGPHATYTPLLLDGLHKRGIHATFFLMGKNIEGKEEIVKQMQKDGHLIGNHTYDHVQLDKLPGDQACQQILKTNNEIYELSLIHILANIELDGLTGKAKWTEDGECDKEPKAFEIKDGAYVEMK